MRAKTKKWFSPLFVLTLAVAGIFGVSAAVVDKQVEETPVVEKADAAAYKLVGIGASYGNWNYNNTQKPALPNNITIAQGDVFKATDNSTWLGYDKVKSGGASGNFQQVDYKNYYNGSSWDIITGKSSHFDGSGTPYLFYSNPNGWTNVYAYIWSDQNGNWNNKGWPGTQMTKIDGVPAIAISEGDKFMYPKIIFNNGSGSQTGDLAFESTQDKNIVCKTAGTYYFSISDSKLSIENEHFNVTVYTIADGGAAQSRGTQSVVSGGLPSYSIANYLLDAWYDSSTSVANEHKITSVTEDCTLYGRYYKSNWCYLTGDSTFLGTGKDYWQRKDAIPANSMWDGCVAAFTGVSIATNSLFQIYYNNATNGSFEKQSKDLTGVTATSLFEKISDDYGGYNYRYKGSITPTNGFNVYMTSGWNNVKINYDVTITLHIGYDGSTIDVAGNSDDSYNPSSDATSVFGYERSYYSDSTYETPWNNSCPTTSKHDVYVKYTAKKVSRLSGTMNGWSTSDETYLMTPAENDQYFVDASLTKNDEFKVYFSDGTTAWYGWSQVDQSSPVITKGYIVEGTDPDSTGTRIKVNVTGKYEVYLKTTYDTNKIWIQQDSTEEANSYAEEFLGTITCSGQGSVTFLINAWNKVGSETTSMQYKYEQLTNGAKGKFTEASPVIGGTKIEQCVARYDAILSKYGYGTGSGQYHDFIGRTPAPASSAIKSFSPYTLITGDDGDNSSIILIIVASSISILSITALSVLMVKKKKSANK